MLLPTHTRIWIVAGVNDMRCGFDGLAAKVLMHLQSDPFGGHVFVFRGRRGDRIKVLWFDGDGMCLFCKRLEAGHFVWPQAEDRRVALTSAQLSMLLDEGIDWRSPRRTAPTLAAQSKNCGDHACHHAWHAHSPIKYRLCQHLLPTRTTLPPSRRSLRPCSRRWIKTALAACQGAPRALRAQQRAR